MKISDMQGKTIEKVLHTSKDCCHNRDLIFFWFSDGSSIALATTDHYYGEKASIYPRSKGDIELHNDNEPIFSAIEIAEYRAYEEDRLRGRLRAIEIEKANLIKSIQVMNHEDTNS